MTGAKPAISFEAFKQQGEFSLDVRFEAGAGITALFGPSGSGKTTILNLIAGISRPQRGRVICCGRTFVDTQTNTFLAMHKRRVGLVFQDAQLFPHLTVEQNIKFGRWFVPENERTVPLEPVVEILGIAPLLSRRPAKLSGGEKQRVGLARALLASPLILLMDEPLAGLDDELRQEIWPLIERVRDEFEIPIVYITHDADEVLRLACQVVMLRRGRVTSAGPPAEILRPVSGVAPTAGTSR
jgi:molybdate transport system ATP-binding protein